MQMQMQAQPQAAAAGAAAAPAVLTLRVENGALLDAPAWESHPRGRNWLAIIRPDPQAPGGLGRTFLKRAHGKYLYHLAGLRTGQPVECGADYYSGGGNPTRRRVYGVIESVTPDAVVWHTYATPDAAIAAAKAAGGAASTAAAVDTSTATATVIYQITADDLLRYLERTAAVKGQVSPEQRSTHVDAVRAALADPQNEASQQMLAAFEAVVQKILR